jgi:hypothetical protein
MSELFPVINSEQSAILRLGMCKFSPGGAPAESYQCQGESEMTMPTPAVPQRMTGRFASSILMYVRANNPDCCFDDVVDDDLVTDILLAATYRTNVGVCQFE